MNVSETLIQTSLLGEAMENGPMAVFVAHEDGRYVAVNQAACQLLGYTRDELLELSVEDVALGGGAQWQEMRDQGALAGTAMVTRKDGERVSFAFVAGATVVAGMPVFVSVGTAAT